MSCKVVGCNICNLCDPDPGIAKLFSSRVEGGPPDDPDHHNCTYKTEKLGFDK